MPKYLIEGETLASIADSIRERASIGQETPFIEKMTPLEMKEQIKKLPISGSDATATAEDVLNTKTVYIKTTQEDTMILNKNTEFTDSFLDINNDIYRIITKFNEDQPLKRLLINTTKKPLQGPEVEKDLRDVQIGRVPLVPYDEEEGSIIIVSLLQGDIEKNGETMVGTIAIDVFTPGNQWIIAEGIRPLMIAHTISNIMKYKVSQTGGVKYRLDNIINAQLSDVLLGYRMIYNVVIDDQFRTFIKQYSHTNK